MGRWLSLVLVVAGLIAYANSFEGPFLLDDQTSVVDNATIRRLWPLSSVLKTPVQFSTAGRPVVNLSLAINYAIGGVSPAGYHAFNLGVHILCALLLFGIVRRTLERMADLKVRTTTDARAADLKVRTTTDPPETVLVQAFRPAVVAFACALIWLVHPLESEVVDYVTQRTESMMAFFYLSTLYCAIRGFSSATRRGRWFTFAIVGSAIGMACKESMATAPLVVLLYDRVFESSSLKSALTKHRWLYAGLASTWIVLIALNVSGPRFRSAGFSTGISPVTYFANQLVLIGRYLRLAFWPVGLVVDYGVPRQLSLGDVWPYGVAIGLLVLATLAAWRKYPTVAFLGTWFFVTLAPTSSIVPISTEVGAERRMYLPMCALVTLVVCGAIAWSRRFTGAGRSARVTPVMTLLFAAISAVLIALTIQRNLEYRADSMTLWQNVLDRYPHARAHYNLGVVLHDAGRREEALREYQIAAAELPEVEYALGFDLFEQKQYGEAATRLRRYIELRPEDANVVRTWVLLGRALAADGSIDPAIDAYRRALQMQPRNIDALGGLADTLLHRNRLAEAATTYQEYVRLVPTNAAAFFNLGLVLGRLNRDEEAVTAFSQAVALSPRDPANHANLANALLATGKTTAAVDELRVALNLEDDPQARAELMEYIEQLRRQPGAR